MFQELLKFWKEEMIKTSIRLNSFKKKKGTSNS